MLCKICNAKSHFLFSKIILGKYNAKYYQCKNCGFMQTEKPYWIQEAYRKTGFELDVGYVNRNISMAAISEKIIVKYFNKNRVFLDFGGGSGLFVRLMRDSGFNFFRYDPFCDNIFAKYFDIGEKNLYNKIELLTAFEVFEHLESPLEEIEKMFSFSNNILFSTELMPVTNLDEWWYLVPESGQHISFYTMDSLKVISRHYNCQLYSNNKNMHLFVKPETKSVSLKIYGNIFDKPNKYKNLLNKIINHVFHSQHKKFSLTESDFNYVKSIVKNKNSIE